MPFSVLRRSFDTLSRTPGGPLLDLGGISDAPRPAMGPAELADWLPRAATETADEAWRRLITRARSGEAAWAVVTAGLALPGLYGIRRRLGAGLGPDAADLEGEMLSALLDEIRVLDLAPGAVCGRLVYAVRKAAQRFRYRCLRDQPHQGDPHPAVAHGRAVTPGARGPVSVLAEAITKGVLTHLEAELIARTHLEGRQLTAVAHELGVGYTTARRRRTHARTRLVRALGEDKSVDPVDAFGA
ncbi:hypothetical protein [Streptomonospora halophila]